MTRQLKRSRTQEKPRDPSLRRSLDMWDIRDLACGTAFLGSGGGGDPQGAVLELQCLIGEDARIPLIDVSELQDDDLVAPCGWMGAPTVSSEKLPNGREALQGLRKLESTLGRAVAAVFPIEIGGSNGLFPLALAARAGIPVVDCDGMGRAFPESQMVVFNIYGCSAGPVVLSDEKGNCVTIDPATNLEEERLARALAIAMGGSCHVIDYPGSGYQIKQHAVRGTVSLALSIGRSIRLAREVGQDPFDGLFSALRASSYYRHCGALFEGKIVDVQRETRDGFAIGSLTLENFSGTSRAHVGFRNENLIATVDDVIVATVPDIISVVDMETAQSITTDKIKYGQRVVLVGSSVPPILRTREALKILGPSAFNMPDKYVEIENINKWLCAI